MKFRMALGFVGCFKQGCKYIVNDLLEIWHQVVRFVDITVDIRLRTKFTSHKYKRDAKLP